MDIVAAIEKALQQTGKSKSGLAKALGKHPNVVTNILKRERRVQLDELPLIKRYLELDLAAPSPEHGISIRGIVGAGDEFYADNADDPNDPNDPFSPRVDDLQELDASFVADYDGLRNTLWVFFNEARVFFPFLPLQSGSYEVRQTIRDLNKFSRIPGGVVGIQSQAQAPP